MARCYHIICCKDRWDPLRKMAAIFSFSLWTFAILSTCTLTTSTSESVDRTFSPSTHLACTCQDGYYKHESVMLLVPRGLCANLTSNTGTSNNSNSGQHTSLSLKMSSVAPGQSSGKDSALHFVSLSMCRSCSHGCLSCSGPSKKDCTACKKDFFLLVDNGGNEDLTRSIRSLDKAFGNGPSNNSTPRACVNSSDSGESNNKNNTSCHRVGEDIEGLDISLTLNGSHTQKSRINNDPELDTVLSQEELLYSTEAPKSAVTAKQLTTPTAPTNLMTTFDDASGETPESPEVMVKLNTTPNDGSKTRFFDCVARCPWGMFADDEDKTCKSCHLECDGCEDLGPNQCLRCKNFVLGNFCVQDCPEGYKAVEANVCQKDEQVVSGVPSSFYIVTPLVAMMIIVMCVMVSLRRHKCTKCSRFSTTSVRLGVLRRIFNEHRNQSPCQDGHEGHQKCYLKKGRLPEFLTLKPFQGEQPKLGSVNVYIDNPLTKKGSGTLGNYSHDTDIDDDKDDDDYDYEDDDGPLYETPGRGSPASFQGRKVTTDARHYLTPCSIGTLDSRKNYTLGSGCSCKSLDSIHSSRTNNNSSLANATHNIQTTQEDEETPTVSDDSSSCAIKSGISEGIKWEICNEMKHMEVPFFDAPPLPERNTPSVAKPVLDPIYSNIDDEIL